jgi:hypothetical protein
LPLASCFEALVARQDSDDLFELAFCFPDSTFDLVFVDAHDWLPTRYAGERPARMVVTERYRKPKTRRIAASDRWLRLRTEYPAPDRKGNDGRHAHQFGSPG